MKVPALFLSTDNPSVKNQRFLPAPLQGSLFIATRVADGKWLGSWIFLFFENIIHTIRCKVNTFNTMYDMFLKKEDAYGILLSEIA